MRSRLGGSRDKTFGRTEFNGFVRGRKFPRDPKDPKDPKDQSDVANSPDVHAASADSLVAWPEATHVFISAEEEQAAHLVEAAMAAAVAAVEAEAGADEVAVEEWGDESGPT